MRQMNLCGRNDFFLLMSTAPAPGPGQTVGHALYATRLPSARPEFRVWLLCGTTERVFSLLLSLNLINLSQDSKLLIPASVINRLDQLLSEGSDYSYCQDTI